MTEDAAQPRVGPAAEADHLPHDHLRKEGWTMALYVAICLIAALTALENVTAVPGHILGLVWGTTVGLALAHVFAFRVAGRLVHDGVLPKADRIISVVQLVAAAAVAVVVSIPILLASTENELAWGRYACAAIIGAVGYLTARGAEHGRVRALLFGIGVLAVATAIAVLKHRLVGH
ncbi:MAG TPA: hypothetical protein VFB83_04630 [Propionibacteriaceae bacterium]|nr:hypothetical protein [Propionibacteriaceae bacterium]